MGTAKMRRGRGRELTNSMPEEGNLKWQSVPHATRLQGKFCISSSPVHSLLALPKLLHHVKRHPLRWFSHPSPSPAGQTRRTRRTKLGLSSLISSRLLNTLNVAHSMLGPGHKDRSWKVYGKKMLLQKMEWIIQSCLGSARPTPDKGPNLGLREKKIVDHDFIKHIMELGGHYNLTNGGLITNVLAINLSSLTLTDFKGGYGFDSR